MLIACACSQTICKEFRLLGHEAYSCDIEPCYGGHPEWHIVGDCLDIQEFFMMIANAKCERIAIENPVGVMSTVYRKPDQIIEPYQFAESENDKENYQTKRICLWLKGLQPLKINDLPRPDIKAIYGTWPNGKARCWHERVSTDKARVRSKTFRGIARAMAEQWGKEMK